MTAMFDRDLQGVPDSPEPAAGALTVAGPYGFCSWVALLVEPVSGRESGDPSRERRRADEAIADAGWLAGQWDPSAGARLELRYLHRPGERLRCVLLGRVQAPTRDAAIGAALRLRDRLGALPAHVRAVPVESAADVLKLLDPFRADPAGLVEVRKQIRAGRPVRPDAGVHYYLAVPRLAAGATSWDPLWQSVADLPQPFMLTVGLEPYAPPAPFVGMLADLATRYGRLAVPGRSGPSALRQRTYELPADPFARYASGHFEDAWRRYQSAVFRARITLASPAPLPEPLVARVAATICAPRGDQETTHVVVAPEPDEREVAWRNVTTLDNARWDRRYLGHLEVPTGLRLLAETMDAGEAASAWRLPPAPVAGDRPMFVSVTGDVINVGDNATFVNRSTVSGSFNTTSSPAGPAAAAGPRLNILLACANPRGSEALRTGEEDRTLRQSIRLSAERDRIDIETLNAVTIDDLRRALLNRRFDIVHFSGHGTRRGLVFEDDAGRIFQPPSSALAELFARRGIKVAVLNACYSLSVGRISAIGTEFTIATDGPLSDPAAIEFTRGFYDALGAGRDVPDAYAEGKGAAALKGLTFTAILLRRGEQYGTS
ncbi:CHAT domain-containing protein [Actinoplanes regularis]|uniref:CHAT domain-containing protein n=1 Tax=Actinoplanes regularis TaxID=52697 RepID=A0A238YMZ4_9ACTN|nr:CHAT domain-containing protein [Actinoplanes regularis]SNR72626.1 CHAT domain-containing protein [Actinoplanes regularis]